MGVISDIAKDDYETRNRNGNRNAGKGLTITDFFVHDMHAGS